MRRVSLLSVFAIAFLWLPGSAAGQATVTLNGQNYQLRPHPRVLLDGPSGPFTASLQNTGLSGKANLANPSYAALVQEVDSFKASYQYTNPLAVSAERSAHVFNDAALRWLADADEASRLRMAIWGIDHVEQLTTAGGNDVTDMLAQFAQSYSIVRNQLAPSQRKSFADLGTAQQIRNDVPIGLALADDDTRAQQLLSQFFNSYCKSIWSQAKSNWTGVSGSAQIVVAGLAPGTYTVTRNSAPLLTGQVVSQGDNTLYFESESGTSAVATQAVQTSAPVANGSSGAAPVHHVNSATSTAGGQRSKNAKPALIPLASGSSSSTVVYLPAPGAPFTAYTVTGATNANPIVVIVNGTAPANGTPLWCQDIGGNLNANGFFIVAGSSGGSFQLTQMYFGGNVAGSGTYTGGGTCRVLTAYTLKNHPRIWFDGPSGTVTTNLANSSSWANTNNPPYSGLSTNVNNIRSMYTNIASSDSGRFLQNHATATYVWYGNQSDLRALAIAKWGIDNFNYFPYGGGNGGSQSNFYCNTSADQCGNNQLLNWGAEALIGNMLSYTLLRSQGQLTSTEISNFAQMVLNDNSISTNGIGGSAADPTISCNNANWSTWDASQNYCGWTYLARHITYAPAIAPGQEGHYTSDYGSATKAGIAETPPHAQNLTQAMLYGNIVTGLALCGDDVRACLLLTQAYTFWYQYQWLWAKSNWSPFTQGQARYSTYVWHPYASSIAVAMKNSTVEGYDLSPGMWLRWIMPYYIYMTLPNNPNGQVAAWGAIYHPADNAQDHMAAVAPVLGLLPNDSYVPYVNYWEKATEGTWYTGGYLKHDGYLDTYFWVSPTGTQTNTSGLPSQFLFKNQDYSQCQTVWGANCITGEGFDNAVSRSGWTTTSTFMLQRAGWVVSQFDHYCEGISAPCSIGDYRIYKRGYLLGNLSGGQGGNGGSGDNVIQLGGSDANWASESYAPIIRWGSTNPTGDSQSRFAYWLTDLSNTYVAGVVATRVHRHVIHFKTSGTQDYIVSYDDIAAGANQEEAFFHYGGAASLSTLTATYTNGAASRINSQFLAVSGQIAQVVVTNGIGICASANGSTCNTSATSGEWVAVHQPSSSTSATMPTMLQPTCTGTGGNCTVVDIRDPSSPKVAVFARQGALLTEVNFTSTHAGTAQYLVAGLAAGNYTVTVNGATNASGVAVNAGDNTLYFESASGTVQVTQGTRSRTSRSR